MRSGLVLLAFEGRVKEKKTILRNRGNARFLLASSVLEIRRLVLGSSVFLSFFWGIPVFLCKGIHTNPLGIYVALIGPFNQFALLNFVFLTLCIDSKESCINLVNILLSLPLVLSCR